MSSDTIFISGAGIGGLTAALALIRKGVSVRVLEQASELKEVGAGLQLSPNALRALFKLGLETEIMAVGVEPAAKEIRLWDTGQAWKLFDLGAECLERYGFPYLMMYRPDLLDLLYKAVERQQPGTVVLSTQVVDVSSDEGGVTVITQAGQRLKGRALIAADGVRSAIRNKHFGEDQPAFSGCVAWRGVIPAGQLPHRLRRNVGVNWVGPGGHIINYPLRRGELMNFVGILERDDWQVESWTTQGSVEECHADFKGWHEDIHAMVDNIKIPFKWALLERRPLTSWTKNRVLLLGDAAHPTLPFLAQGAGMAIEDGYIVADAIEKHVSLEEAFTAFEQARIRRCTRIVEGAINNGKRFHNPELADEKGAAAYVSREWAPDKVEQRYDWLFSYKVDEVFG